MAKVVVKKDGSGEVDWNGANDKFTHMGADARQVYERPGTHEIDHEEAGRLSVDGKGRLNRD